MKQNWFLAVLVGLMLMLGSSSVYASSHAAGLSEFDHLMFHMNLTWQAIAMAPASVQLTWAMLGDQALCATMSPLTGVLFGTAWSALVTFFFTVLLLGAIVAFLTMRLWNLLSARSRTFGYRLAMT